MLLLSTRTYLGRLSQAWFEPDSPIRTRNPALLPLAAKKKNPHPATIVESDGPSSSLTRSPPWSYWLPSTSFNCARAGQQSAAASMWFAGTTRVAHPFDGSPGQPRAWRGRPLKHIIQAPRAELLPPSPPVPPTLLSTRSDAFQQVSLAQTGSTSADSHTPSGFN